MTQLDRSHFEQKAREIQLHIQAAQQINAKVDVLSSLTEYAALLIQNDYKGEATNVLAYVMNHPDVPFDVYDRADDLFIDLEAELCPRVIADAKDNASFMTMRGIIEQAFAVLDGDNNILDEGE